MHIYLHSKISIEINTNFRIAVICEESVGEVERAGGTRVFHLYL